MLLLPRVDNRFFAWVSDQSRLVVLPIQGAEVGFGPAGKTKRLGPQPVGSDRFLPCVFPLLSWRDAEGVLRTPDIFPNGPGTSARLWRRCFPRTVVSVARGIPATKFPGDRDFSRASDQPGCIVVEIGGATMRGLWDFAFHISGRFGFEVSGA